MLSKPNNFNGNIRQQLLTRMYHWLINSGEDAVMRQLKLSIYHQHNQLVGDLSDDHKLAQAWLYEFDCDLTIVILYDLQCDQFAVVAKDPFVVQPVENPAKQQIQLLEFTPAGSRRLKQTIIHPRTTDESDVKAQCHSCYDKMLQAARQELI